MSNELQTLRISIARLAQTLGVTDPLVTDVQGKPLGYSDLVKTAQSNIGWNTVMAQCVEMSERNLAAENAAKSDADTLRKALKEGVGFIEAWQCHLSDAGQDHAAATVGQCLESARKAL